MSTKSILTNPSTIVRFLSLGHSDIIQVKGLIHSPPRKLLEVLSFS